MTNYAIIFDLHNISALQGRVNLCVSFAGGVPPPGRRSADAGKVPARRDCEAEQWLMSYFKSSAYRTLMNCLMKTPLISGSQA